MKREGAATDLTAVSGLWRSVCWPDRRASGIAGCAASGCPGCRGRCPCRGPGGPGLHLGPLELAHFADDLVDVAHLGQAFLHGLFVVACFVLCGFLCCGLSLLVHVHGAFVVGAFPGELFAFFVEGCLSFAFWRRASTWRLCHSSFSLSKASLSSSSTSIFSGRFSSKPRRNWLFFGISSSIRRVKLRRHRRLPWLQASSPFPPGRQACPSGGLLRG